MQDTGRSRAHGGPANCKGTDEHVGRLQPTAGKDLRGLARACDGLQATCDGDCRGNGRHCTG
eukprot:8329606-Alexandrium_andersonii.AAC.1